jgi:hypothetical protein
MADDLRDIVRKKYAQKYSDPLNPTRTEVVKVSEKQRRLWDALNEFIIAHGGWVVSVPGLKVLRMGVQQDSALPAKLTELGYQPHHCGLHVRISGGKFLPVDSIEISLPGK